MSNHINWMIVVKGLLIGLSIAAPLGPIAFLCIRQTVSYGLKGGLIAGLGTTLADIVYTYIIVHVSHFFTSWVESYKETIEITGGIFLIYLAWKIYQQSKEVLVESHKKISLFYGFITAFVLNFLSPMTTFLFISLFVNYRILDTKLTYADSLILAGSVGIGSFFWWSIMALVFSTIGMMKFRINLTPILGTTVGSLITPFIYKRWPNFKNDSTLSLTVFINNFAACFLLIYGLLNIFL